MALIQREVKFALALMVRSRLWTAVTVGSLALAISATGVMFSLVKAALFSPFPYDSASELVVITGGTGANERRGVSKPNLDDLLTQGRVFEDGGAFIEGLQFASVGAGQLLRGTCIDAHVLHTLGTQPILGRGFTSEDERESASPSILLGYGLWRSAFGGERSVVGQHIVLNERPYRIVGVMPEGFFFPDTDARVWISMPCGVRNAYERGEFLFHGIARLRPDISPAAAHASVEDVVARLKAAYPDENAHLGSGVFRLEDLSLRDSRRAMLYLVAALFFVMLMACANVVNLLLARGAERRTELAIRISCGASVSAIVRQLLIEAATLALISTIIGLALAAMWLRVLVAMDFRDIPRLEHASLNLPVSLATTAAASICVVCAALGPAIRSARFAKPADTLRGSAFGHRLPRLMMFVTTGAVAAAFVLLLLAAISVRAFIAVSTANWGIRPDGLYLVSARLPAGLRSNRDAQATWIDGIVARTRSVPGVSAAASTNAVPARWINWKSTLLRWRGRIVTDDWTASAWIVGPGFFRTAGTRFLAGKDFEDSSSRDPGPSLILSKSLASQIFGIEQPIGQRVELLEIRTVGGEPPKEFLERHRRGENLARYPELLQAVDQKQWEVIGVVDDIRTTGLEAAPGRSLYINRAQLPLSPQWKAMTLTTEALFVVRAGDGLGSPDALTAAALSVAPVSPHVEVVPMVEMLARSVGGRGSPRLLLVVSAAFAVLSTVFALSGISGLLDYVAISRSREFEIRAALGASTGSVMALLARSAFAILALGVTAGALIAWLGSRFVETLMPGLSSLSWRELGPVALLLMIIVLLGSLSGLRLASRAGTRPELLLR